MVRHSGTELGQRVLIDQLLAEVLLILRCLQRVREPERSEDREVHDTRSGS
ncbi:hypothetical protein KUTG_09980 [Kutzneria sp. 744]|nr:hypothetical protein KUTG_09980 [Kutzneria sp. 744]